MPLKSRKSHIIKLLTAWPRSHNWQRAQQCTGESNLGLVRSGQGEGPRFRRGQGQEEGPDKTDLEEELRQGVVGRRTGVESELSHPQIRASRQEIAKSLEGNWRPELLVCAEAGDGMYDIYQRRIAECDKEFEGHLKSFADNVVASYLGSAE